MSIQYIDSTRTFHLKAKNTSYIFQILKDGYLGHLYWGKKVNAYNHPNGIRPVFRVLAPYPDEQDHNFSLDSIPQEYPSFGKSDFRNPAFHIQLENGSTVTDLRYVSHKIRKGKPPLDGLPATYVENEDEADTLEIILKDTLIGLTAILSYTTFNDYDAITRTVQFINEGNEKLKILKVSSVNVDFQHADFEMITLPGAWARERYITKTPIRSGLQSIESRRGASSPQQNPFMALISKETTEDFGEVYAFNFVYSGNFLASVEVDQYETTRATMGINPFDFSWMLKPGESFQAPEVVMVYSDSGLSHMSHTFHRLYRTRLCRGEYRDQVRPILINNWEATYFNFNEEKLLSLSKRSKELGIELFVLDDGWFGNRNNDRTSLGDWYVNRSKLPNGLDHLATKMNELGMKFGLWFEPEMVSVDSDLYREHPDWCIHVPKRSRTQTRSQLILDFSRADVCNVIIKRLSNVLESCPIKYVKWDMNRHMTEIGSNGLSPERQRETAHRYMLGVYRVMDEITSNFPHILFESCSSGGGRFDPGMLYYMPQTWTSDNTDAIARLKIQYGTSLVYPIITMGAHVAASPSHQAHRVISMEVRGHVAMSGNLGYELDLTRLSQEEQELIQKQVELYKDIRSIIQFGDFYRLANPFTNNHLAWIHVAPNQNEAILTYVSVLSECNAPLKFIRLKGLDPLKKYRILELNQCYYGDELMNCGINIPQFHEDFKSIMWRLKAE